MVESESTEKSLQLLPPPPTAGAATTDSSRGNGFFQRRPKVRVTTEYDSDSAVFFNKISCKLLDSLAKLKLSFQNDGKGEISDPQLAFTSKYLSLHYDVEERNALVKGSFDGAPGLEFKAVHDVKDEQMAFIPRISLSSNAVSFAFKRRFGPADKLRLYVSSM